MNTNIVSLLIMAFYLVGCNQTQRRTPIVETPSGNIVEEKCDVTETTYYPASNPIIGNTTGFITIGRNEAYPDTLSRIIILNDDNSIWMSFYPDYNALPADERDGQFHEFFSPWAFAPGIEVFVVRCVGETDSGYLVVVNERFGLVKDLTKHPSVMYAILTEHLLEVPFIGFDVEGRNPVREFPFDDSKIIFQKEIDEPIHAVDVKGDWIKIKNYTALEEEETISGWIKWRENNRFIIDMYYSW